MKKQILILAMFTLAIFASTTEVFAQFPEEPPRPLVCGDTLPLHPRAGVPYEYVVETPSGDPVGATNYMWWATKNPNFIDTIAANAGYLWADTAQMLRVTPGELENAVPGGGGTYGNFIGHDSTITITWSAELLAATEYQGDITNWQTASSSAPSPTFVAVLAQGDCTDNIEVFELDPGPAFTVDIMNLAPETNVYTPLGYDVDTSQCVDVVRSALYDNTSKELVMDYGTDTLFFEVIAANYVENWRPYFVIEDGLFGNQEADISWYPTFADAIAETNAFDAVTGWTPANITAGDTIPATQNISHDATVTTSANGVSIFVKVVIHHNDYELDGADAAADAANRFRLALDGRDNFNAGQWDLPNNDPLTTDCTANAQDLEDAANHTLLPRPTINMNGGAMLEPSGTDPENLIIKTNDAN